MPTYEAKNEMDNSDTDDFDEFYNDKGFLNTGGMNKYLDSKPTDWYQENQSEFYPTNLNRVSNSEFK